MTERKRICRGSGKSFKTKTDTDGPLLCFVTVVQKYKKSEGIAECLVTNIWSWPAIHFTELVPLKNQSKG